jgi:adapter protein MecA 1/2
LDDLIRLSHVLNGYYTGQNVLYKSPQDDKFYLVISKSAHTPEEFNKTCNILTEYGTQCDFSAGQDAYFKEHYRVIIAQNAIAMLAQL